MNERIFKVLAVFFVIIVLMSLCNKRQRPGYVVQERYDVNVQTIVPASEGLDLKAVGELLREAKDAEEFEKLLNSRSTGINNLDLNEDGKVDYIKVTEYGDDKVRGFSLTTEVAPGDVQEIATIEVEKVSDNQAQMQIRGNEQIYGANHYYHSSFGLMDFLILSYLFRPHTFYASPWGYGSYPPWYSPYSPMPYQNYRNRTAHMTRGSTFRRTSSSRIKSTVQSPNAGKAARSVRAPLKNPTASQKAFQARNPSRQVKSGGFGRRTSRTRAASVRRSASRRSGGFAGGK